MTNEIVIITDDKGREHTFDNFSDLIEFANTCGCMGWLPDNFNWRIEENEK